MPGTTQRVRQRAKAPLQTSRVPGLGERPDQTELVPPLCRQCRCLSQLTAASPAFGDRALAIAGAKAFRGYGMKHGTSQVPQASLCCNMRWSFQKRCHPVECASMRSTSTSWRRTFRPKAPCSPQQLCHHYWKNGCRHVKRQKGKTLSYQTRVHVEQTLRAGTAPRRQAINGPTRTHRPASAKSAGPGKAR